MVMRGHSRDAHHRVGAARRQQLHGVSNVLRPTQRRRRLEDDHDVGTERCVRFEPADGVLHDRKMRRVVAREIGGAHEWHLASERAGRVGDGRIVGRENEPIDHAGLLRRLDRVRDERLAAEQLQILARNAFRPAPRGDHAEHRRCHSAAAGHDAGRRKRFTRSGHSSRNTVSPTTTDPSLV